MHSRLCDVLLLTNHLHSIVTGHGAKYSGRMLLVDGFDGSVRTIKMRGRQPSCIACGDTPTITPSLMDYEAFCGTKACDMAQPLRVLDEHERITCAAYKAMLDAQQPHVLIDTRHPLHFEICALPHAVNVPIDWFASMAT